MKFNAQLSAKSLTRICLFCLFLLFGQTALAAEKKPVPQDDPHKMLQAVTDQLLTLSKSARDYAKDDPERYYGEVELIIIDVIDIDYFARGVMATYASSRLYASLKSEPEKAAFRARIEHFTEAMKRVLLVTYANSILSFVGERIDLAEAVPIADRSDKVSLQQTIYDLDGQTYNLQYSLHNKKDKWLVFNMIVEGVNLGGVYRNQFAEAVEKNKGDLDYVVDHWVELMSKMNEEKAAEEKKP